MRNTLIIIQFFLIGISFGQIENGSTKAFCKEVVTMLTAMDELSSSDFKANFISYDELMEYKEDSTVSENVRKELSSFTIDRYHEQLGNAHSVLQNVGFKNFKWKNIKFKGTDLDKDTDDGVPVLDGLIKIKCGKSEYAVHCVAVRLNGVYKLVSLDQPQVIKEVEVKSTSSKS